MCCINRTRTLFWLLSCVLMAAGAAHGQTTYYVNDDGTSTTCTGWGDACPDLQTALGLAASGDQIWVAAGTYRPDRGTGDREASFNLLSGVGIYGGFAGYEIDRNQRDHRANVTVLSGDLGTIANSDHVVWGTEIDHTAILDGFTITGGGWAGVRVMSGSPQLVNCTMTENIGRGIIVVDGSPTLINCIVTKNWAQVGGGGGMFFGDSGHATLINCLFAGNWAGSYEFWEEGLGGGLWVYGDVTATLVNCTFVGNWARGSHGGGGGLLVDSESTVTLTNCIFWGNRDSEWGYDVLGNLQIGYYEGAVIDVTYTCVMDDDPDDTTVWPGTGNIDDDPSFAAPGYWDNNGTPSPNLDDDFWVDGDHRPAQGSPCIDVGNNNAVPIDTIDLDGDGDTDELLPFDLDSKPRIANSVADMGPYEQADCNSNGIADAQDIAEGTSQDCNENGVPDDCDLREGTSNDANGNRIPDECEGGACCQCPPASGCLETTLADCNDRGGGLVAGAICAEITCPDSPPGNDDQANATEITDGTYTFDTLCASTDGPPQVDCENGTQPFGSDIWFTYTASCTGELTVLLCDGTDYNAIMGVVAKDQDSAVCPMECGDDTCGATAGPPWLHRLAFQGHEYTIRIGGWNGTQGTGQLSVSCQPSTCPPSSRPEPHPSGVNKNRYLSFSAGDAGRLQGIRVTASDVPAALEEYQCARMWVGKPREISENAGKITPPPYPSFMSANLQCDPYCMDWSAVGLLYVTDDDIVPGAVYDVQAIDCDCDFSNEANYSAPLTITTSKWGDLVGHCAVIPCTPPDGVVNVTTDVTACVDKFRNLEGAVLKSRADIEPNFPDWLVNIADVTYVLDAFRGFAYPAAQTPPATGWPGPDGCP